MWRAGLGANMAESAVRPAWKLILAGILDFFTVFATGGYLIGKLTGGDTEGGFKLDGWPALLLFALIIAYFVIGKRMGGTLWRRIFGVAP